MFGLFVSVSLSLSVHAWALRESAALWPLPSITILISITVTAHCEHNHLGAHLATSVRQDPVAGKALPLAQAVIAPL